MKLPRWTLPCLAVLLTLAALVVVPKLRLSGNLSRLFPDDRASRALGSYVEAFGGGDVTTVLVRGDRPDEVRAAAEEIAERARGRPGIHETITHLETRADGAAEGRSEGGPDPSLAWAFADDDERARLATAVSEDGMRARLAETRTLLLTPGSGALVAVLTHDPLRLWSIVGARARGVAATVASDGTGDLVADEGRARFVLVRTEGSALDSDQARRVVDSLEEAVRATELVRVGRVRAGIAGGAAIARDVERLVRRDLVISSGLSLVLVSLAFVLTFRRPRALVAIGPPLLIGTLWTAAVAALVPQGISAIAMGFASVVIGVGLDTGVHVVAAVGHAREAHPRGSIAEIAAAARRSVGRPTLTAALAAGCAFAALGLSRLSALRELGLLCAAGEVLTALAILALTPELAAAVSSRPVGPMPTMIRWSRWAAGRVGWMLVVAVWAVLGVLLVVLGPPRPSAAIVAVKPAGLPALVAQEEAIALTSGNAHRTGAPEVQLTVVQDAPEGPSSGTPGEDSSEGRVEERLLERAERLSTGLSSQPSPRVVESLTTWLPSRAAMSARLEERDGLGLPERADLLARLATEAGFATESLEPALDHFRHPASLERAVEARGALRARLAPIVARHLGYDRRAGRRLVATYVRGPGLDPVALAAEVARLDSKAVVTGYPVLEGSLRAALASDLPPIGLVALLLVTLALRTVLRSAREVLVALGALAAELVLVAVVVRLVALPLHAYDALVVPVLVGITVDESMFLLHAMRRHEGGSPFDALATEGRAIMTTALTTAAGFGALVVCGFPGLRDVGVMGVLGTVAGLIASLLVVPVLASALLPKVRASEPR